MIYWRNWSLYVRGFRWLWTRQMEIDETLDVPVWTFPRDNPPPAIDVTQWGIEYKPGWGPWRFLGPYLTTYLAGVACGRGVVSISRLCAGTPLGNAIDWVFQYVLRQRPNHCRDAGPRLWGSRSVW